MKAFAQEKLRRAMPYGMWRWRDEHGRVVETLFNRRYEPIAARIDGQLVRGIIGPAPTPWPTPVQYFHDGRGRDVPWRSAETLKRCRTVLESWGIEPADHEAKFRAALLEDRRRLWAELRRRHERGGRP